MRSKVLFPVVVVSVLAIPATASEMRQGQVQSDLVPGVVEYNALLPDAYEDTKKPLPLLLYLDGGGGSRNALVRDRPSFDAMWNSGELPPVVVVTPSVSPQCFYVNYRDGSQKWESFLTGPFLRHIRDEYVVDKAVRRTAVMGMSMGGAGSLHLGLKHLDQFGIIAALEPGIMPALDWSRVPQRNRFFFTDAHFETLHGKPIDAEHWRAYNPASIVADNADAIRESGLRVYIECGDEDVLLLQDGTEFLHRLLQHKRIRHEYRLVLGADHVGKSVEQRLKNALRFLGRSLRPVEKDPVLEKARENVKKMCPVPGAADPGWQRREFPELFESQSSEPDSKTK